MITTRYKDVGCFLDILHTALPLAKEETRGCVCVNAVLHVLCDYVAGVVDLHCACTFIVVYTSA